MRNASVEWMARVAARNAIEIAKAQRTERAVALSAVADIKHGDTEAQREVAK